MASKAQPSPPTSWLCVAANGPLRLDSPCVQSFATRFSCRCANQVDSSPHLFLKLTWTAGNDRETSKVCWESMLEIWLVVEILSFRKLCNGFGLNLNVEPGSKVDFDHQDQEMEPVAVRRFGYAVGNKCTLLISWGCSSAALAAVARKSTLVVCHWNLAEQVCDSQRS